MIQHKAAFMLGCVGVVSSIGDALLRCAHLMLSLISARDWCHVGQDEAKEQQYYDQAADIRKLLLAR